MRTYARTDRQTYRKMQGIHRNTWRGGEEYEPLKHLAQLVGLLFEDPGTKQPGNPMKR